MYAAVAPQLVLNCTKLSSSPHHHGRLLFWRRRSCASFAYRNNSIRSLNKLSCLEPLRQRLNSTQLNSTIYSSWYSYRDDNSSFCREFIFIFCCAAVWVGSNLENSKRRSNNRSGRNPKSDTRYDKGRQQWSSGLPSRKQFYLEAVIH